MAKKMLVDATHDEETRIVVAEGNRVDEFDFESSGKRILAGNIYLAKVKRIEPSLQAAFIEYGGNRHGFLPFSEIHPDYFQIPVADRQRLVEENAAYSAELSAARTIDGEGPGETSGAGTGGDGESEEPDSSKPRSSRSKSASAKSKRTKSSRKPSLSRARAGRSAVSDQEEESPDNPEATVEPEPSDPADGPLPVADVIDANPETAAANRISSTGNDLGSSSMDSDSTDSCAGDSGVGAKGQTSRGRKNAARGADGNDDRSETGQEAATGAVDEVEEAARLRRELPRRYKIQEVIQPRQILLVQIVKEERGNKGVALTTYLSLAGRYCVLMPNTPREGGISRKITNATDRKKLKKIASEIQVPSGAGLIIRTAGAKRTKTEIRRDFEYLSRQWNQIRDLTLKSIAPALIYEEGNLIKRAIRDLYSREIEEILVEGDEAYKVARAYMKMLLPSHLKRVKHYKDPLPLFARYKIEDFLDGLLQPVVKLKSGGYIVIDVTEALVAIDVNSGRATRQSSIAETALRTNLEAAEEVGRQLRLRDLAGLIVIDFIDMDDRRSNANVEKTLKDVLKSDRARIQIGQISGFGILEMSRQRLRPGMLEATARPCPHCHGTGSVRSNDSLALSVLRQVAEESNRCQPGDILAVRAPIDVAGYLVNEKRREILALESGREITVRIEFDTAMAITEFSLERRKPAPTNGTQRIVEPVTVDSIRIVDPATDEGESAGTEGQDTQRRSRRKRRRRSGRGSGEGRASATESGIEIIEPFGDPNSEAFDGMMGDSGTPDSTTEGADPTSSVESGSGTLPREPSSPGAELPAAHTASQPAQDESTTKNPGDESNRVPKKPASRRSRKRRPAKSSRTRAITTPANAEASADANLPEADPTSSGDDGADKDSPRQPLTTDAKESSEPTPKGADEKPTRTRKTASRRSPRRSRQSAVKAGDSPATTESGNLTEVESPDSATVETVTGESDADVVEMPGAKPVESGSMPSSEPSVQEANDTTSDNPSGASGENDGGNRRRRTRKSSARRRTPRTSAESSQSKSSTIDTGSGSGDANDEMAPLEATNEIVGANGGSDVDDDPGRSVRAQDTTANPPSATGQLPDDESLPESTDGTDSSGTGRSGTRRVGWWSSSRPESQDKPASESD